MIKIFNNLQPFFEDNYQRIHVREFAKLQKISPPTASRILEELRKQQLLKKEVDKQYHSYFANKDSNLFKDLQNIYWKCKLQESGLIDEITSAYVSPTIILFGSLSKGEARKESDIDLAILTPSQKKVNFQKFEKKLHKEIHMMQFQSFEDIPSNLKKNILNGYKIIGNY